MLIDHYELDVFTLPCDPGAEHYAATALLVADISAVLPYLNATLRGAVYHSAAQALTWKKGGHSIAFHARKIAISNVEDRSIAIKELDGLVELVNRTWERRDKIEPSYETRQRPAPLTIYRLLPRTNCRACGESTCFTFALKLAVAQKTVADCPPLREVAYAGQLAALEDLLPDAPAIG